MNTQTVYNATTGTCILDGVSEGQYGRWYDCHSDYRAVRDVTEVNPAFRELFECTNDRPGVHWLVQD